MPELPGTGCAVSAGGGGVGGLALVWRGLRSPPVRCVRCRARRGWLVLRSSGRSAPGCDAGAGDIVSGSAGVRADVGVTVNDSCAWKVLHASDGCGPSRISSPRATVRGNDHQGSWERPGLRAVPLFVGSPLGSSSKVRCSVVTDRARATDVPVVRRNASASRLHAARPLPTGRRAWHVDQPGLGRDPNSPTSRLAQAPAITTAAAAPAAGIPDAETGMRAEGQPALRGDVARDREKLFPRSKQPIQSRKEQDMGQQANSGGRNAQLDEKKSRAAGRRGRTGQAAPPGADAVRASSGTTPAKARRPAPFGRGGRSNAKGNVASEGAGGGGGGGEPTPAAASHLTTGASTRPARKRGVPAPPEPGALREEDTRSQAVKSRSRSPM